MMLNVWFLSVVFTVRQQLYDCLIRLQGILKNPLPAPSRMNAASRLSLQSAVVGDDRPVTANVKGKFNCLK